ncbi:PEP-CTERM sorting domain-containing protein [Thalassobacterium sedimentorum]|nr:PEP-CTERM sorting domain-containing protein [Coraliomargarita sp. SDUM461004]
MRNADAVSSAPWFNVDAYGFTTSPSIADTYIGSDDSSKTKLYDNLLTPATQNNETISFEIAPYLQTLYSAGTPTVTTVYIRLNPDDPDGDLGTDGDDYGRYRPLLFNGLGEGIATLSIVPEPSSYAALLSAIALSLATIYRRK